MKWRWLTAAALAAYCMWSVLLIAQRPGLQYDEALLTSGAIALRHQQVLDILPRSGDTWTCHFNFCFPLMAGGRYIGAPREYLAAPLFALFGAKASIARLSSVLLTLLGLWGIGTGLGRLTSPATGGIIALILAMHPAFLAMTVFDNGAVSPTMAALGLCCWALAIYATHTPAAPQASRNPLWPAFLLGAALGFGIWARANFLWTEAGAILGAILILRRRAIPSPKHILTIVLGALTGSFPFLWYQVLSRGGTFEAVTLLQSQQPWSQLLAERWISARQVLLADGEHLVMWGTRTLPAWQMWFFPALVAAAAIGCLLLRDKARQPWPIAQATALALAILTALEFSSRLQIAEHHLIALVPLAAATVVFALALLQSRFPRAWIVTAAIATIYTGSAAYWNIAFIRGLHETGGLGVWSSAITDLTTAAQTEAAGREIKILDWGFLEGMLVLSDGSLRLSEWNDPQTPQQSRKGKPWAEEIREGGLFLLSGADNHTFPEPVSAFLDALSETHPVIASRQSFLERTGLRYAELLDIQPNTIGQGPSIAIEQQVPIDLSQVGAEGFYDPAPEGWRWASKQFRVPAPALSPGSNSLMLRLDGFLPEASVAQLGNFTISARIAEHRLPPMTLSGGIFTYSQRIDPAWLQTGSASIEFDVDKGVPPNPGDTRSMAVVVSSIAIRIE